MKTELENVMKGLFSSIEQGNRDQASQFMQVKEVKEAVNSAINGDVQGFYFSLLYPISNTIDGVVATITDNHSAQFILKHSDFIENQFVKLIIQMEGSSCSADKSSTIMDNLFKYYMHDTRIEFDYTQKFTYHLPNTVFKTHEDIILFFKGVYHLYYGNPKKYLDSLLVVSTPKKDEG